MTAMKMSTTNVKDYYCSYDDLAMLSSEDLEVFVEFFNWLKSATVWGREAQWYDNKSLNEVVITFRNSRGLNQVISTKKDLGWKLQEIKHFEWTLVSLQF